MSIDRHCQLLIDRCRVNRVREGDYSIGSWADDHHHDIYAEETTIYEPGADEVHECFTYEELLNMQRRNETDQHRSKTAWGRTRYRHPIDRARRPSIDINPSTSIDLAHTTSIDIHSKPKTTPIEQKLCSYINATVQNTNRRIQKFYDAAGGIDKSFKLRSRHPTRPSIDVDVPTSVDRQPEFGRRAFDFHGTQSFYWEEKDQYGVYRDDQGYTRDLDGNTIRIHNMDIRRVLERASRDEPSYICLPGHASSFTHTKLIPEIYTNDEINEMFYGVCGEQEKNKEAFQMKLDGVYYPLNDSISWLTTCMEEIKQDIARIQHVTDVARSSSIDRDQDTSINVRQRTSIDN
ncbi:hypothetical protein DY000_02008272 [Brassica cretica]|uniref:Aminotransferase-like plant mobile domain-containing protein n=1 Tax=Brassica cretica TaxID=69181 RepID=A0ABQ7BSD5_BRACR|nr:hypothetical protein DY000_02008272 [Brassica cretica]